jgi:hypothetical protein
MSGSTQSTVVQPWVALKLLKSRFDANVTALASRYPDLAGQLTALSPAEPYFIRAEADRIYLAAGQPPRVLPMVLPPEAAQGIVARMFPAGKYEEASLIAGEDLGWLWNALYRLPCHAPKAPGHRPPLFFLMRDVERLWAILHVQDWQQMLGDHRVRLFVGGDAVERFSESLHSEPMCPWPKLSVTVDPAIWPAGVSLETVIAAARERQSNDLVVLLDQLHLEKNKPTPAQLAERIGSGRPLRIMGLTSRYTTFLQYSMRDWLAGLERLGHQTKLFIEPFDHEVANNLVIARECEMFRPDLIVAIDHARPTLFGVLDEIPVVMWVQDRLPHIYDRKTGASQGPLDYVIGYARQELTQRFGYPASRFMPAMVGVNDRRFVPRELTPSERDRFGCEVSFVSHATMPAEQIIAAELKKQEKPEARALLDDVFQQLRAIYESGGSVSNGHLLEKMIDQTLQRRGLRSNREGMMDLFVHKVNNALFRHQAVRWAAQSGVNLHLYGNGWENHPEFAKFARGVADNQEQLPIIYQASAINLQVTPFGAVHQRLLDGLVAGGFFLLRSVTADELEVLRKQIWEWCGKHQVSSGAEMLRKCDDELTALLVRFQALWVLDPRADIEYFYAGLDEAAISNFQRTANTLWIESPRVTFSSQPQLTEQIKHFLKNPDERKQIVESMRQRVLETHTYQAVSRRMLEFIAADLGRSSRKLAA